MATDYDIDGDGMPFILCVLLALFFELQLSYFDF